VTGKNSSPDNSQDMQEKNSETVKRADGGKKKSDPANTNIFISKTVFPDPGAIFTFRLKSVQEIKENCFVVLDTNALLLPYTATSESIKQIGETYSQLKNKDRLRIPAQVAREFAKNRPRRLVELYQQLSRKRSLNIQSNKYPLLESQSDYEDLLRIEAELIKLLSEYRRTLGRLLDHIKSWTWNDPVSTMYNEIFVESVIVDTERTENEIREDLSTRIIHNIPPGYKDDNKDDDGVGDLLIWH
jgi:rRNA-processing protein FCF1